MGKTHAISLVKNMRNAARSAICLFFMMHFIDRYMVIAVRGSRNMGQYLKNKSTALILVAF